MGVGKWKDKIEQEVFNFDGPGIALSMYNLDNLLKISQEPV